MPTCIYIRKYHSCYDVFLISNFFKCYNIQYRNYNQFCRHIYIYIYIPDRKHIMIALFHFNFKSREVFSNRCILEAYKRSCYMSQCLSLVSIYLNALIYQPFYDGSLSKFIKCVGQATILACILATLRTRSFQFIWSSTN